MRRRNLLALALLTGAATVLAAPAYADTGSSDPYTVHLRVTQGAPMIGDDNALIYPVTVTNDGPGTATGIVTTTEMVRCPSKNDDPSQCDTVDAQSDPVGSLPPGASAHYPIEMPLDSEAAEDVQTTTEVTDVDQMDSGSQTADCLDGENPAPDCATTETDLSQ